MAGAAAAGLQHRYSAIPALRVLASWCEDPQPQSMQAGGSGLLSFAAECVPKQRRPRTNPPEAGEVPTAGLLRASLTHSVTVCPTPHTTVTLRPSSLGLCCLAGTPAKPWAPQEHQHLLGACEDRGSTYLRPLRPRSTSEEPTIYKGGVLAWGRQGAAASGAQEEGHGLVSRSHLLQARRSGSEVLRCLQPLKKIK